MNEGRNGAGPEQWLPTEYAVAVGVNNGPQNRAPETHARAREQQRAASRRQPNVVTLRKAGTAIYARYAKEAPAGEKGEIIGGHGRTQQAMNRESGGKGRRQRYAQRRGMFCGGRR